MIKLTRLNHVPLIVNSDLIEHIEATPDTVITLTSGQKFMVRESSEEIVEKVIEFRKSIFGKDFKVNSPPDNSAAREATATPIEEASRHGR